MDKVITSIKENKKKHQYTVSFGLESLTLSEDAFTDYFLYVGKEISVKDFNSLKKAAELEKAYTYAVSLLLKGGYSTYEIRKKLKDKFQMDNLYLVIDRLKQNGFLDDEEFAKQYKEEKENQLYGSLRIKDDLLHKKMIEQTIVDNLCFSNEAVNAEKHAKIIEKKFDRFPLREKKRKAIDSLIRRGFPPNISMEVVSSYKENKEKANESFLRDFDNLSNRYKKKYSGYAYKRHLFEALLRRGYAKEMINEKINGEIYDND